MSDSNHDSPTGVADRVLERQSRMDKFFAALIIGFLLAAALAIAMVLVTVRLSNVLEVRNKAVEALSEFEERAECADQIEAAFEVRLADVILVNRADPAAIEAVLADIAKDRARSERVQMGDNPCDVIADSP